MDLVAIAAGWFWMGRDGGARGERPRHRVWTDAFAIGRTPVTNREYRSYLAATRSAPPPWWTDPRFHHDDQPVVGVNWFEAVAYCEWLSAETGQHHRLPTEAEWEKAARGGLDGLELPWGDRPPDHALGAGPGAPAAAAFDRPPVVSDTPANPFGLFALSGVCHEWCLDWDDDGFYAASPPENPCGPPAGTRRISRGGAWRHRNPWSDVAHRSSLPPALRYSDYGMRVVRGQPVGGP